jgi:hypothetical protein
MHYYQWIVETSSPRQRAIMMAFFAGKSYQAKLRGEMQTALQYSMMYTMWEAVSYRQYYNRTGIDEGQATKGEWE